MDQHLAIVYDDTITIYSATRSVDTLRMTGSGRARGDYESTLRRGGWRVTGSWRSKVTAAGKCPIVDVEKI